MSVLSFKDFRKLSSQGNLIPLVLKLNADTETPVSAFLKMTQGPYRFLFESMEGGERWGRYSFLGSEPAYVLQARDNRVEKIRGKKVERLEGHPLDILRDKLKAFHPVPSVEVPRLAGGFVGFFAYDMVRHMERLPDLHKPGLPFPDSVWMLQDSVVAFDNVAHQLEIVVMSHLDGKTALRKVYDQSLRRLEGLAKRMRNPLPKPKNSRRSLSLKLKSNTSEKQFHEMVRRAQEYMRAGDIFQVVLSQRWASAFKNSPFQVYRELRQINPSPYLFYLEMGAQCLTGSSPEVNVRLDGSKITLRPIAGTRRRGRSAEDEIKMQNEMLQDPKEIAEHVMLVDLGRNDVGRVSKTGTVQVTDLMAVEKYSHVMHIVSNVEGQLLPDKDAVDVLKATFPAGTLSGAPKIRAMEIIEELEQERRGPYGGAVGYFDFYGNMDTAITIRSLAFAAGKVWFQAGGGIVLDSKPELEYLESCNKARVMMEALRRCCS